MKRRNGVLLFLGLLVACRLQSSRLTGPFIADARSGWMEFLTMTQTDKAVSGYLMSAKPDGRGGTESQTTTIEGTTDGESVTLQLKSFLNLLLG